MFISSSRWYLMIRAKSFSKTLYNNNDKLYSTCTPISTSHHLPRNFQKFSRFKESDIGARDKNHKPNSIQYSSIHILPYLTTRKNLSSLSSIVEHRQRREISFFSGYFSPLFQKKKKKFPLSSRDRYPPIWFSFVEIRWFYFSRMYWRNYKGKY